MALRSPNMEDRMQLHENTGGRGKASARDFSPRVKFPSIEFPAPSPEVLADDSAAAAWFRQALSEAGEDEPAYEQRPGLPHRPNHDARVFALARAAKPIPKGRVLAVLSMAGRLPHLIHGTPMSDGATCLLVRLVGLLSGASWTEGMFMLDACNRSIAHELDTTTRTIARHLSELHHGGYLYRHFTTGSVGLRRQALDLGPLVSRLEALEQGIAQRAMERAEMRAERARCVTLSDQTGGDDNRDILNTNDSKEITDSVSTNREEVAASACGKLPATLPSPAKAVPTGRPEWKPRPTTALEVCPALATFIVTQEPGWPELVAAGYAVGAAFGLSPTAWGTLCSGLGREWAALTVGLVANMPATAFTRSHAPTLELKRGAYLGGIARKLERGEDVGIVASWFRQAKKPAALASKAGQYESKGRRAPYQPASATARGVPCPRT